MRVANLALTALLLVTVACTRTDERNAESSADSVEPRSLLDLERQHTNASLRPDRPQYDFGRIPIDGGTVETIFEVSNKGSESVQLVSVYTSCGCTTAVLEFADGSTAGPFGMPGHEFPAKIDRSLGVGEELRVRVTFDPAAHGPDGVGKMMRTVTLHTGDGAGTELVINADVVKV